MGNACESDDKSSGHGAIHCTPYLRAVHRKCSVHATDRRGATCRVFVQGGGALARSSAGLTGSDVRILVLGPQLILKDGEELAPPAPQQRRVLSVLASRPSEVVSREWIANQLWGAAKATQLRGLQSYVSHLRSILGSRTIELVGGGYRLNLDPSCIDEVEFKRLVAQGLEASMAGRFRQARHDLEVALALYRGEPYDDLGHGDFETRRTGLRQLREAAEDALLRIRVDLIRGPQDCDSLIPQLAEAYAEQPDRELRVLLYARTLAMAGRLSEAGDVYKSFRARLKAHTGAEPSAELTETMTKLAQRDKAAMSMAWGSTVVIPAYTAALIGRTIESHAAVSMLEVGGSSLVTITGPSGVGKTRVAAAVARELADDLPGGVIWVDAGSAKRAEDLLARIAEEVGLSGGAASLKQALPKALGERRTLVVLDGLDQVDAKSAIAILLWAGPKVSVVVTSTTTLGLASEQVLTLQPLSTSGSDSATSQAATFVMAILVRLGVNGDPGAIQAAVKRTQGLPSELEQVALDFLTQSVA